MKIACIGVGKVGAPLAVGLAKAGHQVVLAASDQASSSVAATLERSSQLVAQPVKQAVEQSEIVFLATPFAANESVLAPLADTLAGKTLVDCTNPVGPGLLHALRSERSGSEQVQSFVPRARVVKAFSIYGYENLEDPVYPDYEIRPVMMFCGDHPEAKQQVAGLVADLGFEPLDVGPLSAAVHLEHMTLMWVRMVRAEGQSPHLVWAALRRPRPTA